MKTCGCGRPEYNREQFTALPLVGFNTHLGESDTREKSVAIWVVEQRNCACGNTLATTHAIEIGPGQLPKDARIWGEAKLSMVDMILASVGPCGCAKTDCFACKVIDLCVRFEKGGLV